MDGDEGPHPLLPLAQRAGGAAGVALQHGAEQVGSGERAGGAHARVERHAPGRVAEQHHPARVPGRHDDLVHGVEQLVLRRLELVQQVAQHHAGGFRAERQAHRLGGRTAELGVLVVGAVAEQGGGLVVGEREHPGRPARLGEHDAVPLPEPGHRILEHADAEDVPERPQVFGVRAEGQTAHRGAQAVRTHHQVEPLRHLARALVRGGAQGDVHAVGALLDRDGCGAEPQVGQRLDGVEQRALDVATQQHPRVARHVAVPHAGPAPPVPLDVVGDRPVVGPVADRVQDAQPLGGRAPRAEHRHEVPGAPALGGAFDQHRLPADVVQAQGRGQASDPHPDDQCAWLAHLGASLSYGAWFDY